MQARPLLDERETWLRNRLLTLSTQSDTTKAINYMLNQWQALVYYCDDGIVHLDIWPLISECRASTVDGKAFCQRRHLLSHTRNVRLIVLVI